MRKLFLTGLLGLILLSSSVFAAEMYQYSVNTEIFDNFTAHYDVEFIFTDHADENFSFFLISPENIQINSVTDCKIEKKALGTEISCFIPSSKQTFVELSYNSREILSKKENYNMFSDSFRIFMDTKTLSVIVKLPEGSGLKEPIENSYSPADALKGSDGRKLIINWLKNDLKEGDRFDVSIAFESFNEIIPSGLPVEIVVVVIFILIIGSILIYRFYLSKRFLNIVVPILKDDEKLIFNALLKHGDGVNQKIIVKESGYSKAKVSKVLKSLNERGIIRLERIGRKNKVYMDTKFKNKA